MNDSAGCHPERSEGSPMFEGLRFFAALSMTVSCLASAKAGELLQKPLDSGWGHLALGQSFEIDDRQVIFR
jgi:hypothetical protein